MEHESQKEQDLIEQDMDILVEIEDLRAIVGGDDKADAKKPALASSMCPW